MKRKILFNILAIIIFTFVFSPIFVPKVLAVPGEAVLVNPLKTDDLQQFLLLFLKNIVIKVGSIVAVCFLIWSGYLFVEGRGNPTKIGKAKEVFTWTIVGIVILLGAQAIAMIVTETIKSVSGV